MKIKANLDIHTANFGYDLLEGGYLNPKDICANEEDVIRVTNAIEVIREYYKSCCNSIEDFII